MESLMAGTLARERGSFRCRSCGYILTLASSDACCSRPCAGCGWDGLRCGPRSASRTGRPWRTAPQLDSSRPGSRGHMVHRTADREAWLLDEARTRVDAPGDYLPLRRGWAGDRDGPHPEVDADRAQSARRPALRRPDRLAPARARDPRGRRRARILELIAASTACLSNGERVDGRQLLSDAATRS